MKLNIDKYLKTSDLKNKSTKSIKSEISYLKLTSAVLIGLLIFAYGLSFFGILNIAFALIFTVFLAINLYKLKKYKEELKLRK
ncbi:hypothetical protein KRX57_06245 [Weeksellaceae bacterium TAE3-ERU29]|nr:hypothetical protein [Weeksellaceae bacterium TAE3-ERU29]